MKHHRSGALYSGTCNICPEGGFTAEYVGESGYSAYVRSKEHQAAILTRDKTNAFAKHLAEYHPAKEGDVKVFSFKVIGTFRKPMERLISEAVKIHGSEADIVMNSRAEWHQPAIDRVVVTRELPA